ncbi:MAG TPA: hypothetical protein VIU38_14645 [Anaerolineales bacterium]
MTNPKNGENQGIVSRGRGFRGWGILLGLVLVAILALAPTLLGFADAGSARGHAFDVTFTKWVTVAPNMVGVVGGAVGPGTFAGEIMGMSAEGSISSIDARYHISGSRHSFTADIRAVQDNDAGTGVITGSVTDGWLNGSSLTGEYTVEKVCPIETLPVNAYGTMCFQGTLHVVPGP